MTQNEWLAKRLQTVTVDKLEDKREYDAENKRLAERLELSEEENDRLAKRLETATQGMIAGRLKYKERDFIDENRLLRAELACYGEGAEGVSRWLCRHGVHPIGGPYCGFVNAKHPPPPL